MSSKPIIRAGMQWRIGDGKSVRIWEDEWIPNFPSYSIQQPPDSVFEWVADLIDIDNGGWDIHALHAIFPNAVVEQVLSIPLSKQFGADKPSWKMDTRGRFSVKTAYPIARDLLLADGITSSSDGDPYRAVWSALWKAKVPSKVAIFGWRIAQNLLPTRTALIKKGYDGPLSCCVCNTSVETLEHLFRDCRIAKEILSAPPFALPASSSSWKDWFLLQAQVLSSNLFDKLLIILWNLWNNRNDILWRNEAHSVHSLVASSMAWYEEYLQANENLKVQKTVQPKVSKRWSPPQGHGLKLNVDGAYLPNINFGGTNGVIRDSHMQFHACFATRHTFTTSALHTELLAIQKGLYLVQALQIEAVTIESDSLLAGQAVNALDVDLSSLGAHDIRGLVGSIRDCQVNYVPRQANRVAHRLASFSYENEVSQEWFGTAPEFVEFVQDALIYDIRT